jgi:flagellar biosynthesis/type III secretory pathway chaperone
MPAEIIDLVHSLTAIIEDETDKLTARGHSPGLPETVAAKMRLTATLEERLARLGREQPDWIEQIDPELAGQMAAAVCVLRDAAAANAAILERQISLSTELMEAIAAEAQRLIGARNATYCAGGALIETDRNAPIAINTQL